MIKSNVINKLQHVVAKRALESVEAGFTMNAEIRNSRIGYEND